MNGVRGDLLDFCQIIDKILAVFISNIAFLEKKFMSTNHSNLIYRPEIDGLRALAVISVIFYHLSPASLSGGFLGVDIFFVISGFLITKIITTEMANGTFSFQHFYTRRIKRIFPVFILVMAIASLFASLFFIRSEGELQRKGIEAGILFYSNFFLANRQGYWDLAANENPILHIWSLAVEEQYYLLFPILLFLFYRKSQSNKTFLKVTIGLFVFFSLTYFLPQFIYNKMGLNNYYYVSNLRFPELLVGSCLALLPTPTWTEKRSQAVSILAFIAILICLFTYHSKMPLLLNGALLLPCVLTAVLISAMNKSNIITSLFSAKPVVFIGKLSYSLYLFHWLFIAWAHYITGAKTLSLTVSLLILVATFICSLLSYFLLETPIRHSKISFKKAFLFIYLIPSLVVVGYNLATKSWVMKRNNQYKEVAGFNVEKIANLPAKVAVFGDSHSGHLAQFLNYIGNREGWRTTDENVELHIRCHLPIHTDNTIVKECEQAVAYFDRYPIIIVSMFYDLKRNNGDLPRVTPREFFVPQFDEKFQALIRYFAKQNKKVYVFADVKTADRSPLRAIFLQKYGLDKFLEPIGELGNKAESNAYIHNLIKDIPNVHWVDPTKYLPQGYFLDGLPLYSDQDHLTNFGSYKMAEEFHKNERLIDKSIIESSK